MNGLTIAVAAAACFSVAFVVAAVVEYWMEWRLK